MMAEHLVLLSPDRLTLNVVILLETLLVLCILFGAQITIGPLLLPLPSL